MVESGLGKLAFYAMIESAVKYNLSKEIQADNGQHTKHLAELNEIRQKDIRDEVEGLLTEAMRVEKEMEQELEGVEAISNVQFEHAVVNGSVAQSYSALNDKYSELQLSHDQKTKQLELAIGVMKSLCIEGPTPDEQQKAAKRLLVEAENKYMLMGGKRETIDMIDAEVGTIRQEVSPMEEEYTQLFVLINQ